MYHGKAIRNGEPSGLRSATNTGDVWSDILLNAGNARAINIMFPPGARTHWHTHEGGQFIYTVSGEGWIQERGGERVILNPGDVVWTEPGVEHWHGASETGLVTQIALHFGNVDWQGAVTDEEYVTK